ncbi:hypothetical protein PV05_06610 [Exophiala xenobiotica]|uniref:AB hydrolase-1 domain-containing protein n=1 Tax=Exophiala xenobiotica TaxID=348802 RepID=A0A0D2EHW8_9EURO|nr:uncharacterized protein PV05_06610 [Exophiala xenobiotica]KIW54240.1 hypothetical protein PV05_06610 [Exophiala xenobiotica]
MPELNVLRGLLTGLLLTASTLAVPVKPASSHDNTPTHPGATCATFTVPVSVSLNNSIFSGPRVDNNIDAVNFVWDADAWDHPAGPARIVGSVLVQEIYNVEAQLCVPLASAGNKREILQVATHGGVFDKRYWDSTFEPDNYSFVRGQLSAGYSILTYDRLGVGGSDKPDGYTHVTIPTHIEVLKDLSSQIRSGKFAELAKLYMKPEEVPMFSKIVHIGHSLGSATTIGFLGRYGDLGLSDGTILTGWIIANTTPFGQAGFGWEYGPEHDPVKYAGASSGYLIPGTVGNIQQGFFSDQGLLDPNALQFANEIKATSTVGEFQSAYVAASSSVLGYSGPLLYFLAEYDMLICHGDCNNAWDPQTVQQFVPHASPMDIHIQPKTGHGIPLHKNATAGFSVVADWLGQNGL